jgi:hypothetical protein
MRIAPMLTLVGALLGAAGCTGTSSSAIPEPTRARYSSMDELHAAAVGAGMSCPDFKLRPASEYASAIADCKVGQSALLLFNSDAKRIANLKELRVVPPVHLLVGTNWIVNATVSELLKIQPELGGEIVQH